MYSSLWCIPGRRAWRRRSRGLPCKPQPHERSNGEISRSRIAGCCTPSRATMPASSSSSQSGAAQHGLRQNQVNACAWPTSPGDERARRALSARGSVGNGDHRHELALVPRPAALCWVSCLPLSAKPRSVPTKPRILSRDEPENNKTNVRALINR